MKKFVSMILVFCMILLLLGITIDLSYSEVLIHSNDRRYEAWYDLMHGKIDADIIVNGSSRAWVHISPIILDSILQTNTYNLGIDGSSINRQIRKYRLFQQYNRKPKLIIQNIDCWALDEVVGYEREQFFPYFWNNYIRKEFYETEPISFTEKYIPLVRYHGKFSMSSFVPHPKTLIRGYKGLDLVWNGKQYNEIESIVFSYNNLVAKSFDNFLQSVTKNGIKVVFVYTPQYIGATHKITNLNEMHAFYKKIADKYDIPILDYTNMWICNDTTYFYNAMHLNRNGAEIFSDSLANDIKRLHLI